MRGRSVFFQNHLFRSDGQFERQSKSGCFAAIFFAVTVIFLLSSRSFAASCTIADYLRENILPISLEGKSAADVARIIDGTPEYWPGNPLYKGGKLVHLVSLDGKSSVYALIMPAEPIDGKRTVFVRYFDQGKILEPAREVAHQHFMPLEKIPEHYKSIQRANPNIPIFIHPASISPPPMHSYQVGPALERAAGRTVAVSFKSGDVAVGTLTKVRNAWTVNGKNIRVEDVILVEPQAQYMVRLAKEYEGKGHWVRAVMNNGDVVEGYIDSVSPIGSDGDSKIYIKNPEGKTFAREHGHVEDDSSREPIKASEIHDFSVLTEFEGSSKVVPDAVPLSPKAIEALSEFFDVPADQMKMIPDRELILISRLKQKLIYLSREPRLSATSRLRKAVEDLVQAVNACGVRR